MTNDPFYLTEPYREARRKAEADLADWPSIEERHERNFVMFCICAGLAVAIVILYFGTYSYVRTNPPSPTVVHKSSGV